MQGIVSFYFKLTDWLDKIGEFLPQLGLRVILAWEFYEAGIMKLKGDNWFASIRDDFPFPFNVINPDFSWFLATWAEVLGGIALLVGLATRFFSATLLILTIVAIAAVHWPDQWNTFGELLKGYGISDKGFGNYKLPLIFIIMLLPLIFSGPGKASLDHVIGKVMRRDDSRSL